MVLTYKCTKPDCTLCDVSVPDIRCLRSADGKTRICGNCGERMIVAETISASGRRRPSGRGRSGRGSGRR